MKRHRKLGIALALLAALLTVYLVNAAWLAPADDGRPRLIAHLGVHQTHSRQDVDRDTCTADLIEPPRHDYIENTIRSMQAAFDAGADVVELDVHPTTDGHFAVFHDWTLDCRTNGTGRTRDHDLARLKALDIGHGYSADGGRSFPLRGQGIGQIPSLAEVFEAFPEGRFLINFKSRDAGEGDRLAVMLAERPSWRARVWGVYGGEEPVVRATGRIEGLRGFTRPGVERCVKRYLLMAWTGVMPEACGNTLVAIPVNVAAWMWGWPNRLQQRFKAAGSELILTGSTALTRPRTRGLDSPASLGDVPATFDGYLWTDRIEIIGPALKSGSAR